MENNLENVKTRDPVYNVVSSRILSLIGGERLREAVKGAPQLPVVATDVYFLYYSMFPRVRTERNPDQLLEHVRGFMLDHMKSEEYQRVKSLTTLDDDLAMIYSTRLLEALLKMIQNEASKGGRRGAGAQDLADALRRLTGRGDSVRKMLERASWSAESTTEMASKIKNVIGGSSAGRTPGELKALYDLSKDLLSVKWAYDIVVMGSRLAESLPLFVKHNKSRGKRGEEFSGYRLTRDPGEALPRELALPEELFMARLGGGGLLAREMLDVKEGAYYLLLDKSGSMSSGEKTVWSRSIALALYKLARRKGRRFFLRFFDYTTHELLTDKDPIRLVEALLKVGNEGGTSIDRAIRTALKDLRDRKLDKLTNTVILITDGEDAVRDWGDELRRLNCRLVSVMVKGHNESLRRFSHQYLRARLTDEGAHKVIEVVKG